METNKPTGYATYPEMGSVGSPCKRRKTATQPCRIPTAGRIPAAAAAAAAVCGTRAPEATVGVGAPGETRAPSERPERAGSGPTAVR